MKETGSGRTGSMPTRPFLLAVGAVTAAGLLTLAAVWVWRANRTGKMDGAGEADPGAPVDPRLSYSTPYRNVRPDVKYVGDGVCAECHQEYNDRYRHHPMGQAMAPIAQATPIERFTSAAQTPFTTSGLQYAVRREGDRVFHREQSTAEVEAEVAFSIGSGARARSYAVNRDGYLFQSPITWFSGGSLGSVAEL